MDSTTPCSSVPSADHLMDDLGWAALIRHLPDETVLQAHHLGAFRRVRVIPSPMVLLRIILVDAVVADMTFRALSDWCVGQYALSLSHVAFRKRCRAAHCWLAWRVRTLLVSPERADTGLHVELIDATVVVSPRPVGPLKVRPQWRIHLGMDLATLQVTMVDVMPVVGHPSAESLDRIAADPHTLFLGDRAYATVRGLTPHLRAGSQVLVRCPWKNLRLLHADGQRVDLHAWLQETGTTPIAECQVSLPLGRHEHVPMRVVRYALPPEEAAAARKRVKTPKTQPETLFAAGYVLLLTNLPADRWSAEDILALYRYRWQIEIRIKRLRRFVKKCAKRI